MANSCTHSSGVSEKKQHYRVITDHLSVYTCLAFCTGMIIIMLVEVSAIATFVVNVVTAVVVVVGILCSCDYNHSRLKTVI